MTAKSMIPVGARLALGAIFLVFGLNGFFGFLPMPPVGEQAGAFLGALGASGYMFPLIKVTEIAAGLLLVAGRYVPLALTLLAPVVVNIVAFHLFLAPSGMLLPIVIVALGVYLAWTERAAYAPLFTARSESSGAHRSSGGHAEAHA